MLLLWCILFIVSWPLALIALIFMPLVWLSLPIPVTEKAVWAVVTLPARLLERPFQLPKLLDVKKMHS